MTRLNKNIREKIMRNAIDASGVTKRQADLVERRARLADDVRLFALGGIEVEKKLDSEFKKIKKQIDKLDSSLFVYLSRVQPRSDYDISVNFAGRVITLHFNGYDYFNRDVDAVYKKYVNGVRVNITSDSILNHEFDAVCIEQKTINDIRTQVKSEVTAMVNSVSTVKKLLEIWPEAKDLLPEEEKTQSTSLTADVGKLNVMLGLPKEG